MSESALSTLSLWTGLNALLMLLLALNVTRHRLQADKEGYDISRLDRAIRAHGNNMEYVPIILLMLWLISYQGSSATIIHGLGAALFVARLLHAHGIQQNAYLPPTRVMGNFGTWGVMLICIGFLFVSAAASVF